MVVRYKQSVLDCAFFRKRELKKVFFCLKIPKREIFSILWEDSNFNPEKPSFSEIKLSILLGHLGLSLKKKAAAAAKEIELLDSLFTNSPSYID